GGQVLYLSSATTKSIIVYAVDDDTGALTRKFTTDLTVSPGPLRISPNGAFLYAAVSGLEGDHAGVATFKRAANGSLTLLATSRISSGAPYLCTDKQGRYLMACSYGNGDATVYRIVDGICTDELLDRQKADLAAHSVEIDPSGRFVYVPCTTPNKLFQFRLDQSNGKLIPNDPPYLEGPDTEHNYHEPRHYAHHPHLDIAYTSNEKGGGITAWQFDAETGKLTQLRTLSTVPPNFEGRSAAADIKITPNGRFAYVSNRDVTKRAEGEPMQDTLAGVSLDPSTGEMELIGYFPTAYFPRSFCIDLTGRFVYSGGQRSLTLFAYGIDQSTGKLDHSATYETDGVPLWVVCGHVEP
ncbi:MAG: lactonase family protein, partial [Fuerstiella sp.]|nr:lactonase family protein [Fuerstiella sp.]